MRDLQKRKGEEEEIKGLFVDRKIGGRVFIANGRRSERKGNPCNLYVLKSRCPLLLCSHFFSFNLSLNNCLVL